MEVLFSPDYKYLWAMVLAAALFIPVRNLIYTLYMRRESGKGEVEPETAARLKKRADITAGLLCFVFSFLYTPTLFQS